MAGNGLYVMDSIDIDDAYGFAVSKQKGQGKDAFLKPWDTKPIPLRKDWPDQHGTEYDLSERFFKEKEILITGILIGRDYDDFWAKHTAFFNHLAQPGTRRLYLSELGRSFYVFYDSCTDYSSLTPIKTANENGIGCPMTLKFIEPVPSFYRLFVYLVDAEGNYITDVNGDRILITT